MPLYVDVEKRLGEFLLKVKLEEGDGTLALLGASGSGKSMTLKCIAGIEKPDKGKIIVDGVTLFDSEKKINLSPQERRTGLMFQNYALFPHMTVLQNIQAGAKREKDKEKRKKQVQMVLERFGLEGCVGHYPHQLSGGQQQRVALARILVSEPRILLLDEPFSALDSHLRFRLEQEVRQVLREFGKTVVLVSHDREEVYRMSDRIAIMDEGGIQTVGAKEQVFAAPQTYKAALLTGCKNISPIERLQGKGARAVSWDLELELAAELKDASFVGIRTKDIQAGEGDNSFLCRVEEELENPFSYTLFLRPLSGKAESCLVWEVEKELWEKERSKELRICLPSERLLALRG